MEIINVLSAFGLSASAGLNAYIPLLVVALLARFTNLIQLNSPWDVMSSWWIIGVLLVLCLVEFFVDKVPAINHANDIIQTVIRPLAGAVLFAASAKVISEVHPIFALALGLFIAGGVHTVKSAVVRPAVTATTGGAGNIPVSFAEDITSTIVSVLSVVVPVLVACILVMGTAWVVWRIWRMARRPAVL